MPDLPAFPAFSLGAGPGSYYASISTDIGFNIGETPGLVIAASKFRVGPAKTALGRLKSLLSKCDISLSYAAGPGEMLTFSCGALSVAD